MFSVPAWTEDIAEPYVSQPDAVTTYLNAIDRTEAEFNAYSMELTDLYQGLGKSLYERGEFEDAKEAYQQGVQIIRVNFGLNSPDQTNYLFAVADIESSMGNWKSADTILRDIYQINSRHFGADAPGMLPVLEQMLTWYQGHRPAEATVNRYADLERSAILATKMAAIIELDKGLGHPDTAAVHRRIGQTQWFTVKYLLERGISVEPGVVLSTGSPPQNPNTRGISVKSHIIAGRDAFIKVAESVGQNEESSAEIRAEAIAQVGDWNLSFGKKQTAGISYQQAYELLSASEGSSQLADAYFEKPIPVRFMNQKLTPLTEELVDSKGLYLDIEMTITQGGRPLDVKILTPLEDIPGDDLRRIKRDVSSMRFRPRLNNGVAEKTKGFVWQLPIADIGWLK